MNKLRFGRNGGLLQTPKLLQQIVRLALSLYSSQSMKIDSFR
jgi:hypothetical protein